MHSARFNTFLFKHGKHARNRIVVPPMASQTADVNGFVTKATLEHYRRLACAEAGIVFVEYSYVHQSGKGEANQLGVQSDQHIQGLSEVASILKASGSLAGLQIVHAGGKSTTELTEAKLMGPSEIVVPVKGRQLEVPSEMTLPEIELWIQWFVESAHRAAKAGFDLVELHAAHGYGLNQWLSPITNQRMDIYGTDLSGRSRLLFEIVKRIKKVLPALLLSVRLPGQDHLVDGLTISEMSWVVKQLEFLGVDIINVSSGIGGWRRPENNTGEGYLVADASALKSEISIPVIGVGGIETGSYIDQIVFQKKVDFAAVGRAILKSPCDWNRLQLQKSF